MGMKNIRRAFAGILTGLVILATPVDSGATPQPTPTSEHPACASGFRGQPDYDRHCLTTGTPTDARREWTSGYTTTDRRAHCHMAIRIGYRAMVTETRGDVIHDTYVNNRAVVRMVARVAAGDCARLQR